MLGGGEIFAQTLDIANVAVVTFIDTETDGDTCAPARLRVEAGRERTGRPLADVRQRNRYRSTMWRRTRAGRC